MAPAAPAAEPNRELTLLGRGTLSKHLITRVALLVAAVAIILDAIFVVTVYTVLMNNLDDELRTTVATRTVAPDSDLETVSRSPWASGFYISVVGTSIRSAIVYTPTTTTQMTQEQYSAIASDWSRAESMPTTEGATLLIQTAHVPGLGDCRMAYLNLGGMSTLVGVPLSSIKLIITSMMMRALIISAAAVVVSALVVGLMVRATLTPLNRLVQTASTVANMRLDVGDVDLRGVRVPPDASNPNNEVGRVGLAFNTMLDNVEAALVARQQSETDVRRFVADASHELRNPLAAIRGYSELIQLKSNDLPAEAAFAMSRIDSEAKRMSSLVEDLLLLARLDNDQNLDLAETDLVDAAVIAVSDAQAVNSDHTWVLDVPPEPVLVLADHDKLHQVLSNLLSNARKHTPPETKVETAVTAARDATGREVAIISVTDDGPGIDPQIRDKVFERFVRADVARAHTSEGSTGLGLSIVAAVVKAHGGTVTVQSEPGCTRFTITLPLYVPPPAPTAKAAAVDASAAGPQRLATHSAQTSATPQARKDATGTAELMTTSEPTAAAPALGSAKATAVDPFGPPPPPPGPDAAPSEPEVGLVQEPDAAPQADATNPGTESQ